MTVFIAGKYIGRMSHPPLGIAWELQGIFNRVDQADVACVTSEDFYFPVPFGVAFSQQTIEAKDCTWPRRDGSRNETAQGG